MLIWQGLERYSKLFRWSPVAAYWAKYYVVWQILDNQWHTRDDDCRMYAEILMDHLESFKDQHADDPSVVNDDAAKKFVEYYGQELLAKADAHPDLPSDHLARGTLASHYLQAATTLRLSTIWESLSDEILTKIRYAEVRSAQLLAHQRSADDNEGVSAPDQVAGDQTASNEDEVVDLQARLDAVRSDLNDHEESPRNAFDGIGWNEDDDADLKARLDALKS